MSCLVVNGIEGFGIKVFYNFLYKSRVFKMERDVIVGFWEIWEENFIYLCELKVEIFCNNDILRSIIFLYIWDVFKFILGVYFRCRIILGSIFNFYW